MHKKDFSSTESLTGKQSAAQLKPKSFKARNSTDLSLVCRSLRKIRQNKEIKEKKMTDN